MRLLLRWSLVLLLLALAGCEADKAEPQSAPTAPTPVVVATTPDRIEFRVSGLNLPSVLIRNVSTLDGTSQVTTTLPYFVALESSRSSVFLSLEVTTTTPPATGNAWLLAQIFVNGNLFREATAAGFMPSVTISGTYRRGGQ